MNYFSVKNVSRQYGVKKILDQVSFGLSAGEKVGLVGENGSGKSTLMKIICGLEKPDEGEISLNRSIRVGYLPQEPRLEDSRTIFEEVLCQNHEAMNLLSKFEELSARLATTSAQEYLLEMERLQGDMERKGVWDLENRVKQYLNQIGFQDLTLRVSTLSGGERKKVAIARLMLSEPDLLLLDEPTNHLDTRCIEWLEEILSEFRGAILVVTHDRYFLTNITSTIVDLDQGRLTLYEGNYDYYLECKVRQEEIEANTLQNQERYLKRELEWVRKMPRARGTKAKYRLDKFDQVKASLSYRPAPMEGFRFGLSRKPGNLILEWNQLSKSYEKILFKNSMYKVLDQEKIGVIGQNGAGKSTFVKALIGEIQPDEGVIQTGQNTVFSWLSQNREFANEEMTVKEWFDSLGDYVQLGEQRMHIKAYMSRFLFGSDSYNKKIRLLSGGERARLQLAGLVASPANFLVLDEPTNDLDLRTLRLLEESLIGYEGCALIVSHDRYFLDRVCTTIIEIGEEETPMISAGNYSLFRLFQSRKQEEKKNAQIREKTSKVRIFARKLSFKEQNELKSIEEEIMNLEVQKKNLEQELAALSDYSRYSQLASDFETTRNTLEKKYQRWEELEQIRDQEVVESLHNGTET